jgi:hypothetical protein
LLNGFAWDGEVLNQKLISKSRIEAGQKIADYLMVTLDSFTDSPSNIKQSVDYSLQISNQGLIEATVNLTVENKGDDFQGYARLLVPAGSLVVSAQGGDKGAVLVEEKDSKTEFGVPLNIKKGEIKKLKYIYQLATQIDRSSPTTYSITLQKQLGIGSIDYNIQLSSAANYSFSQIDNFAVKDNSANISISLGADKTFFLRLNPQP